MGNNEDGAVKEIIDTIRKDMSQLDDRIGKGDYNVNLLNTLEHNIRKLLDFSSITENSRKEIESLKGYFEKIKTKARRKKIIDEASTERFDSIIERLEERLNKKNDWKDSEVVQVIGDIAKQAGDKVKGIVKTQFENNTHELPVEYSSPIEYKKGMKNKALREQNKTLKVLLYSIGGILGLIFLFSGHPLLFFIIAIVIAFVIFNFKE